MTTYLATYEKIVVKGIVAGPLTIIEDRTVAFCSRGCLYHYGQTQKIITNEFHTGWLDDHYEFDETCANCGATIPASNYKENQHD